MNLIITAAFQAQQEISLIYKSHHINDFDDQQIQVHNLLLLITLPSVEQETSNKVQNYPIVLENHIRITPMVLLQAAQYFVYKIRGTVLSDNLQPQIYQAKKNTQVYFKLTC